MADERPWEKYLKNKQAPATPAATVPTTTKPSGEDKPWEKYLKTTTPAPTTPAEPMAEGWLDQLISRFRPAKIPEHARLGAGLQPYAAKLIQGVSGGLLKPEDIGLTWQPKTTAQKVGATAAELTGWTLPISALGKVTAPISTAIRGVQALGRAAPLLGRTAQWAAAGAIAGVPEQAVEVAKGKPVAEAAKELGKQAALWGGAEATLGTMAQVAARSFANLLKRVPVQATEEAQQKALLDAAQHGMQVAKEVASPAKVPEAVGATYRRYGDTREFINRALSSVEGWLRSKGQPGEQIVNMAREVERLSDQQVTRWTRDMLSKVARLSREERLNLREVVRGLEKPKNAKVAEAAEGVRAYYAERPARIQQANLTLRTKEGQNIPFQPQENHFPLRLDWRRLEEHGRFRPDALRQLVETGQAKDIAEAEQILRILRRRPYERHATFQHEAERIRLPEYEVDPLLALRSDLGEGETRIAQALVYGTQDERLLGAVEAMHPVDIEHARLIANRLRGIDAGADVGRHIVEGLLTYNTLTKLGLAAIPNATQTVNTALKLGVNQLVRGIRNAVANKQEAIEFAQRAGIHLDPSNVARVVAETYGGASAWSTRFLRATGFATTEFWNRLITSQAAKGWAEDMFQALKQPGSVSWVRRVLRGVTGTQPERIRRLFAEAGVNVEEALQRGSLSEDDMSRIVRWVVQRTQFPASQLDVPLWASSPWGRVVFQFKRYAFNQSRLIRRELWDEAVKFFRTRGRDGSLRAWGPFLTLFPSAGWIVGAIRDWIAGKETPVEKVERIKETAEERGLATALLLEMLRAYAWVGGIGILSDTIQQLQYGPEKTAVSLLGPSAGVATDVLSAAQQGVIAGQKIGAGESPEWGERARAVGKVAARQLPIVGRPMARGELPFGVESETLNALFAPEKKRKLRSDWLPR